MSNINQTQNLFALDTVQDLDDKTAATCSGGVAYLNSSNPDVILYDSPKREGQSLGVNASTGDGISNVGILKVSSELQYDTGFNDKTSSLEIKRGVWNLYKDNDFNTPLLENLKPGAYVLGDSVDNTLTSLKRIG